MVVSILSFDVGYRNLAFVHCVIEENKLSIHKFGLKDFGKTRSVSSLVPDIVAFLKHEFCGHVYDHVIIENQPGCKLRSVQFVIQTYFETIKNSECCVRIVPATIKFHGCKNVDTRTYSKRKSASVDIVMHMLRDNRAWFSKHSKLDDLCDAFLQCVGFCKKQKILKNDEFNYCWLVVESDVVEEQQSSSRHGLCLGVVKKTRKLCGCKAKSGGLFCGRHS